MSRNPLRLSDVERLEKICSGRASRGPQDRIASGFFLYLVFARACYSDGQNVCFLRIDGDYLVASVGRSKTSYTLERKTTYLPMSARLKGFFFDSFRMGFKVGGMMQGFGTSNFCVESTAISMFRVGTLLRRRQRKTSKHVLSETCRLMISTFML